MRGLHRQHGFGAIGLSQRAPKPFRQARNAQFCPELRPLGGDFAQDSIDHALHRRRTLASCHDLDRVVDNAMGCTTSAQFNRGQPQHVLHCQARILLQVFLQDAVGPFQPAQSVQRQPLGPCPILRRQLFQRAATDGARLPVCPDQHGGSSFARDGPGGRGHHDAGHPGGVGQGRTHRGRIEAHPLALFTAARTASAVAGACRSG